MSRRGGTLTDGNRAGRKSSSAERRQAAAVLRHSGTPQLSDIEQAVGRMAFSRDGILIGMVSAVHLDGTGRYHVHVQVDPNLNLSRGHVIFDVPRTAFRPDRVVLGATLGAIQARL